MHNFCDGIFIGAGFASCDSAMGWSITAATVYHELAQEISDFIILTDPKQGGLNPFVALGLNFVSGLSVMLGAIVILSAEMDNYATGLILAYGGGVYVQVAAGECMPKAYLASRTLKLHCIALFCFFIGAAAIGLVLLDHKHCAGGDGHDHGHAH